MASLRRCSAQALEEFVRQVLQTLDTDDDIAREVARHLVRSNLSGHDSHGVIRLEWYVSQIQSGEFAPSARPQVLHETEIVGLIDARRGMGHYSTAWALDWALGRVARHGLAAAAIRHSTHIGRLGEYAERAVEEGKIAIVTIGVAGPGVGVMVLFGGQQRFLGANPWAIGIPASDGSPLIFDGSTTTVAEGKVRVARDKGAQVPPDCIIDSKGNSTTDPNDLYAGGALLPLGARVAGHKGFGLGLASAVLGGLAMIGDPDPTLIGAPIEEGVTDSRGTVAGVFLIVIDPSAFGEAEAYRAMVNETLAAAKRVPPAKGVKEVLVPGELERKTREQRGRDGIPFPEATWNDLAHVAERLGVPMPTALAE